MVEYMVVTFFAVILMYFALIDPPVNGVPSVMETLGDQEDEYQQVLGLPL